MAAAITGNGRYFIQKLAKYIENKLQEMYKSDKSYVVYSDTDSVYFQIEVFVNKFIEKNPNSTISERVDFADNFEKKVIQPLIKQCIDDFSSELNAYNKDVIGAEREIIADAAVLCAKKKYYARVRDSEGTRYADDEPKIKVMGLEIIKSSTPKWSKKNLKKAIPIILDSSENELRNWLKDIKQDFINVQLSDISASGGVTNLDYTLGDKGVPIGARSALVYNQFIKDNKLDDVFTNIQPGDKTKRLFLTSPNPFNSNIIAYTNDNFASKIKEYNCIDYDTNFEKNFLKPLQLMTDSLNYNLEKETASVDDW